MSPIGPEVLAYGPDADQVVTVEVPAGTPDGTAVLVHGGYWRAPYTAQLMEPMAADLVARGWVVANVEYRRVGAGGGWPTSAEDVRAAVAAVRAAREERGWTGPLALVGHSAGGHLALLTADLADLVVALAPVTDLRRTRDEHLGQDAVRDLLPPALLDDADTYAHASPVERLPLGVPVLVVHGDADDRVPVGHSRAYTARGLAAGDEVELVELPGVDHFQVIDPADPAWASVVGRLARGPLAR